MFKVLLLFTQRWKNKYFFEWEDNFFFEKMWVSSILITVLQKNSIVIKVLGEWDDQFTFSV